MIQRMLTIWSLVPLPFLNPAWTSGSSVYILLKPGLENFEHYFTSVRWVQLCCSLSILWHCLSLGLEWKLTFSGPVQFSSVQLLSHVRLFAAAWIAALQASLSITNSRSSLKLTSIESVMPSSHLILCRPLLLLSPIPPSIRVFSNESALRMRWLKYWSFSFSIIPSKEHPGLISFRMDWLDLLARDS